MATAETARLIASLELQDKNFTKGIRKVEQGVGRVDKKLGAFSGAINRNMSRAVDSLISHGARAIVGTVEVAAEFEAQLNTINTVARATPAELGKIGESIRAIARETGTTTDDLTQGYYDLVSAGISAADAQNVLKNANTLAIGGLATTAETIDLLTSAINTYGGDATQAAKFTDVFAKSIERGKVNAAEIAGSFANIGPIAANFGIEIEEIGAAYARLTAAGVPASEVTTQMAAALRALAKPHANLKKLQKQTDKNYLSIAGKKGLVEALEQMRIDAKKAGIPFIDLFGRLEGFNFALQTTGSNFDAFNADLGAMGKSSGAAADQMAERQQGLNFQIARLKALAKDAGITIGSKLLPKLTPLADELAEFLNRPATQLQIGELGDELATALGEAAKFAREIPWGSVADAMRLAGTGARAALDLFKSMPAWVQTAVLTGWGLNKITGGAITSLLGGVVKGVLGMNAGVVNLTAGVVNGVPGGAAGAGGAAAAGAGGLLAKFGLGKGGGVLGLLKGGLVVTVAAALASEFEDEITGFATGLRREIAGNLPTISGSDLEWPFGSKNTPTILPEIFGGNGLLGGTASGTPTGTPSKPAHVVVKNLAKLNAQAGRNATANAGSIASRENRDTSRRDPQDSKFAQKIEPKIQATTNAVKNAASIASRENSAQKAELGNVKNALMAQTQQQKAVAVAAAATAVLQGTLQAARDALQTSAVRTGASQQAAATRGVAPPIVGTLATGFASLRATIWDARPVIQSTTVVQKYNVTQRGGATEDSRTRGGV